MIASYCQIERFPGKVRVSASSKENYDPQVLIAGGEDSLFLDPALYDSQKGLIEYDVSRMPDLAQFFEQTSFSFPEACCFFKSLFGHLHDAVRSQPVLLECDSIFLEPDGSNLHLLRAPLSLECWMNRQEDRMVLIEQILEHLANRHFEVYGLLFYSKRENLSFGQIADAFEELYRKQTVRFRLFHKGIPSYRSRKPVYPKEQTFLSEKESEIEEDFTAGNEALQSESIRMGFSKRKPQPDLQDSSRFFALEDQKKEPEGLRDPLHLSIVQAPLEAKPTCIFSKPAVLESGKEKLLLEGTLIQAGRSPECDLCIDEPTISKIHALFEQQDGRWYIRDLKSTNGTWLDDKRVIRRMRLREGMQIRFGQWSAVFHE